MRQERSTAIGREGAGVAVALDERDRPTYRHCGRVAGLSLELGKRCALSASELGPLGLSARLHDVGKIGIPDHILLKTTPFTDDDWAIMKTHAARSQRIILGAGLDDGETIGLAVRHHHERFDGRGYPDGLAGEAIPILARIVAVADAYDAMAVRRNYRQKMSHAQIMTELREAPGQHDPYLFRAFAKLIEHSPFKAPELVTLI
jgi:HD-GYP domain-containing protein (c-di-GMP phosphodiesterase class II)